VLHRRIKAPVQKLTTKVQKEVEKKVMPAELRQSLEDAGGTGANGKAKAELAEAISPGRDPRSNITTSGKENKEPSLAESRHSTSSRRSRSRCSSTSSHSSSHSHSSHPHSNSHSSSTHSHTHSSSSYHTFETPAATCPPPDSDPSPPDPNAPITDFEDKEFDQYGFDHPSTYTPQPWIWIPKDSLGLSKFFVQDFKKSGVEASDQGAKMDGKGEVEVQRGPPDEEWTGGHDA